MTLIPVGSGQANLIFGNPGAPEGAQITLGFHHSDSALTITEMAELIGDEFVSSVLPNLSDAVQLQSVLVKLGPNSTGPSVSLPYANTGSGSAAQATPQVAYLVQKVTALGGRAGRGRMYLPGVTEGSVDVSGNVAGGTINALEADLELWRAAMIAADLPPEVLHGEGSPLSVPTPITEFKMDGRVGTQRRRVR